MANRSVLGQGRRALSLESLPQRLLEIVHLKQPRDQALAEFTLTAAELTAADLAVYYQFDESERLVGGPRFDMTSSCDDLEIDKQIQQICPEAASGKLIVRRHEDQQIIAVPVATDHGSHEVLAVVLSLDDDAEPFVVSLQMVAAHVTLWYVQQSTEQLDWEADATAALVELIGEIENSKSLKAACLAASSKLKSFLNCRQVAFGLKRAGRKQRVDLAAISDTAQFDRYGEQARQLEDVLNEAVVREKTTVWPPANDDRHATLAHRKFAERNHTATVITTPLEDLNGEPIGALMVSGFDAAEQGRVNSFIDSAAPHLGNALATVSRAQSPIVSRAAHWFTKDSNRHRTKILAAALLVLAGILALPLPHKISTKCQLEPLKRRFAVAPYDGVLQEACVEPGDIVKANQLLARMDDQEIQWELSGFLAERDRAAKKRDAALSEHDVPEAQMAQLEVDRMALKIRLLRHQQDNLEVRSVIDGIVIEGDLQGARGAPVKIGQPLFEVAPLERLRLELNVPDEELCYVGEGMSVIVKLDGHAGRSIEGTIKRLRPQAEIRENDNVFVAEVEVENRDGSLRPGMNGRAKVVGGRRMLGWILFHRAWERLSRIL